MTLAQFLKHLRKTARRWQANPLLRTKDIYCDCPIDAVAKMKGWGHIGTCRAARRMRLSNQTMGDIMAGADNLTGPTRRRLLKACGIKEKGKA